MLQRKLLLIALVTLVTTALPSLYGITAPDGIVLHAMRLYNQKPYFPNSDIYVQHTVTNLSDAVVTFFVLNESATHIRYELQTADGDRIPMRMEEQPAISFPLLIDQTVAQSDAEATYRKITLTPNETFSFLVNLRGKFDIQRATQYQLTSYFKIYPETTLDYYRLTAPSIYLSINPAPPSIGADSTRIERETDTVLTPVEDQTKFPNRIAPDVVVRSLLDALTFSNWDAYFQYLDISSLYRSDPIRNRQFIQSSRSEQQTALQRYRDDLIRLSTTDTLALIPKDYTITRTQYTDSLAIVDANVLVVADSAETVYQYTYRLRPRDNSWIVYDISVVTTSQ